MHYSFSNLIDRLATCCTKIDDSATLHQLKSSMLLSPVAIRSRNVSERSSDLSLSINLFDIRGDESMAFSEQRLAELSQRMVKLFYAESLIKDKRRRYPLTEDLLLLWTDAMGILRCHYPVLEEHVRSNLLSRARLLVHPAAIIALS